MAPSPSEIRYALLEWTQGGDRAHSILALKYVRNFSINNFLEGTVKEGEEHLVEWRKGHKPWPVYGAKIIHVASMSCYTLTLAMYLPTWKEPI